MYSARKAVADHDTHGLQPIPELTRKIFSAFAKDPTLEAKYRDATSAPYRCNCARYHGHDLPGQPGFPNLTDDHWLWSETLEEIEYTLEIGINHTSEETR